MGPPSLPQVVVAAAESPRAFHAVGGFVVFVDAEFDDRDVVAVAAGSESACGDPWLELSFRHWFVDVGEHFEERVLGMDVAVRCRTLPVRLDVDVLLTDVVR